MEIEFDTSLIAENVKGQTVVTINLQNTARVWEAHLETWILKLEKDDKIGIEKALLKILQLM